MLSDTQWERIEHLLPGKPTDKGGRAANNRLFVEAVLYAARVGNPWRDLPAEFGNWHSVYVRFARWESEALSEEESRRWTDIISFTINMEQIGDTIERVLIDIEDKKIKKGCNFSDAGMAEICELHARLLDNMRLGMSTFLNGSVRDAQKLLEEKARFRDLERAYAATHLTRLAGNTVQSIETSSLHIDLISDLKRINSHICSIAYPILESAGALAPSRLKPSAA